MTARAYYNEIEPYAAAWLRNLIAAGHIAPGDVDERDIQDVRPDDLAGYTQCHFFAGIGVWSYALRAAGWPDDAEVWTGSCPCQPFSAAGKRAGVADKRHLWPAWHHLVSERRPAVVFGEQVAGKDGLVWFDLVHSDLEALGYACGVVPFPAAGVGAPHIRDRLYFVADNAGERLPAWALDADGHGAQQLERPGAVGALGRPAGQGREGRPDGREFVSAQQPTVERTGGHAGALAHNAGQRERADEPRSDSGHGQQLVGAEPRRDSGDRRATGVLAHPDGGHAGAERQQRSGQHGQQPAHGGPGVLAHDDAGGRGERRREERGSRHADERGPVGGFWRDAEWIYCRDEKWRPVEPGTFPLVDGAAGRVGKLRAYGNAIVAPAAQAFIRAYLEGRRFRVGIFA
jgi:DNA (cytosine-5)-methyltransferase 1